MASCLLGLEQKAALHLLHSMYMYMYTTNEVYVYSSTVVLAAKGENMITSRQVVVVRSMVRAHCV